MSENSFHFNMILNWLLSFSLLKSLSFTVQIIYWKPSPQDSIRQFELWKQLDVYIHPVVTNVSRQKLYRRSFPVNKICNVGVVWIEWSVIKIDDDVAATDRPRLVDEMRIWVIVDLKCIAANPNAIARDAAVETRFRRVAFAFGDFFFLSSEWSQSK